MDPFARKMIRSSFAYAGLLIAMFAIMTGFYIHFHPPCSDQVFSEEPSPDHQWVAVVMQRRCGEEAPFFTHVNLRRGGEPIRLDYFSGKATEGEIFTIEQDADSAKVAVKWTAPNHLAIECSGCAPFIRHRDERFWNVLISYFVDNRS